MGSGTGSVNGSVFSLFARAVEKEPRPSSDGKDPESSTEAVDISYIGGTWALKIPSFICLPSNQYASY